MDTHAEAAELSQGALKRRVQLCLCSGVMWSQAAAFEVCRDGIEGYD